MTAGRTSVERIAVLETKVEDIHKDLNKISSQLDELLQLKTKGMGALGLVGIIFSSGIAGVILMVVNYFRGNHLG